MWAFDEDFAVAAFFRTLGRPEMLGCDLDLGAPDDARWQVRRLFMRPALLLKVSKALGFLTGPISLFLGSASLRPAVCKLLLHLSKIWGLTCVGRSVKSIQRFWNSLWETYMVKNIWRNPVWWKHVVWNVVKHGETMWILGTLPLSWTQRSCVDERTSRVHLLGSSEDRPTGASTGTWQMHRGRSGRSGQHGAWHVVACRGMTNFGGIWRRELRMTLNNYRTEGCQRYVGNLTDPKSEKWRKVQRCREIKDLVAQMAVLNPEMNGFLRNCNELNLWKLLLNKTRKGQLEFGKCKDLYGLFRIQHYPFFDGKANVLLDQNLACCIAVLQMSGCLETLSPASKHPWHSTSANPAIDFVLGQM